MTTRIKRRDWSLRAWPSKRCAGFYRCEVGGCDDVRSVRELVCVECGRVSRGDGRGWRAYLTEDENEPAVAVAYRRRCAVKDT
jgi:hypothetical protein